MPKPNTSPVMAISPVNVLFWVVDIGKEWITVTHAKEEWDWFVDREIFQRDWKLFRAAKKGE